MLPNNDGRQHNVRSSQLYQLGHSQLREEQSNRI